MAQPRAKVDHAALQQRDTMTRPADASLRPSRALSDRALLASVRAFSENLERLNESHGADSEVAAICEKWASRVAEFEQEAELMRHGAANRTERQESNVSSCRERTLVVRTS